jgi:hypothetical protein
MRADPFLLPANGNRQMMPNVLAATKMKLKTAASAANVSPGWTNAGDITPIFEDAGDERDEAEQQGDRRRRSVVEAEHDQRASRGFQ